MKSYLPSLRRYFSWRQWQFLYVVLSLSWLLGPSFNHHFSAKLTFISHYEDPGQPWSWLYRTCDVLAALLLGAAILVIVRRNNDARQVPRFYKTSLILLSIIVLGSLIDAIFPSVCHVGTLLCFVPTDISRLIHAAESAMTTGALVALNVIWVLRKAPWAKSVLLVQALWIAVFIVSQLSSQAGNGPVQFGYQIVITLWIAQIIPKFAGHDTTGDTGPRLRAVIHVIAAWIFFGGFIAVVNAVRNVRELSESSAAYFGSNTAWLSQHGVAVGVALMYISRHLWRGEYRAWQLTSALLWLETLKYAILTPNAALVLLYGLTAVVLFVLNDSFDRLTSVEELRERLKKVGVVAIAAIAALCVGVITLRLKHHQDLDVVRLNVAQFSQHLFLFDSVNDLGPLPHRLVGQVLNVAGLTLLLAILVSLFRPHKPLLKPANEQDRKRLLDLLNQHSNSSEDYFKYWPQPKSYRWHPTGQAVIAYRVTGNVAFALADPVAQTSALREEAMAEFLDYCRQHGWRACFLMVSEDSRAGYKTNGYKLFRIGASAIVDINEFASQTIRNKWWRWVLNKAKKQGWKYALAEPPHSPRLLSELRKLSDTWLHNQNHVERGFALGYFDETYLQSCRLHLLQDGNKTIAFANELPGFNSLPTTTIDLMRFLPDYQHSMPTLLAHTIQRLHEEDVKQQFDLGFVPLASPAARTEQVIRQLGQLLMSEAVSAQGLEQFKNKFAPHWANNYIAFDGDWIDLIHISRQLDNLLKP